MDIRFYNLTNNIKRNKIYKSLPSEYITITGEFRDSVDISNPSIIIDISSTSNITATASTQERRTYLVNYFRNNVYTAFNYVYIGIVHRYYFVKKITLLRKNIISIDLHVDVLNSFEEFIYNQTAFVSRNKTNYHIELPDERRIVTNENEIIYHTLVDTKSSDEYVKFDDNFSDYIGQDIPFNIVAMVKNSYVNINWISGNGQRINKPTDTELPSIYRDVFFTPITCNYLMTRLFYADLLTYIRDHSNLEGFLIQAYAFPFDFKYIKPYSTNWESGQYKGDLKLGDDTITTPIQHFTPHMVSPYLLNTSFILNDTIEDFNDLEPYSKYELYIPYYGYYELNYNALKGHELYLYYIVSFQDGSATAILYDNTEDMIVTSLKCQLGIELPKSSTNVTDVKNRHDANNTSLVLGVIASILSIVGGVATGGALAPLGIAGGALAGAKTIGSYVINEKSNLLKNGAINFNGNTAPLFAPQNAYIRQTKKKIRYALNSNFLNENGGVTNELMGLITLRGTGYTEIADIPNINYVDVQYKPTDTEVDEIISLLKSGVIF